MFRTTGNVIFVESSSQEYNIPAVNMPVTYPRAGFPITCSCFNTGLVFS